MPEPEEHNENLEFIEEHKEVIEAWFYQTMNEMIAKSVYAPAQEGVRYRCPCCLYKTLEERGGYDICPVCFWEDDRQDDEDADTDRAFSPNHMSLTQARENYRRFGVSKEQFLEHVRPPLPEEM